MKKRKNNKVMRGILASIMGLTLFSPFYGSAVNAEGEDLTYPTYNVTYKTIDESNILDEAVINSVTVGGTAQTTSVDVAWTTVNGAESYDVSIGDVTQNVTGTAVTLNGVALSVSAPVSVAVKANAAGKTSSTAAAVFTYSGTAGAQTITQKKPVSEAFAGTEIADTDFDSTTWTSTTETDVSPSSISYTAKAGTYLDGWYYVNHGRLEKAETLQTIGAADGGDVTLYGRYIALSAQPMNVTVKSVDSEDSSVGVKNVVITVKAYDSNGVGVTGTTDENGEASFSLSQGHYEVIETDISNATSGRMTEGSAYVPATAYRYLVNVDGKTVTYAALSDCYSADGSGKSKVLSSLEIPNRLAAAHTVTYHLDGGSITLTSGTHTGDYSYKKLDGDKAYSYYAWKDPATDADGTQHVYAFDAWYTDPSYTTKFDFTQSITADTSIYAHFIEAPSAKVTVNFIDDNAQNRQDLSGYTLTVPVTQGIGSIALADPTKTYDVTSADGTSASYPQNISYVVQQLSAQGYEFTSLEFPDGTSVEDAEKIPYAVEYDSSGSITYIVSSTIAKSIEKAEQNVINVHFRHSKVSVSAADETQNREVTRTVHFVDADGNPLAVWKNNDGGYTDSVTQTAVIAAGGTVTKDYDAVLVKKLGGYDDAAVISARTNSNSTVTTPWETVYAPEYTTEDGAALIPEPMQVKGMSAAAEIENEENQDVTVIYREEGDVVPVILTIEGNKESSIVYDSQSHTVTGITVTAETTGGKEIDYPVETSLTYKGNLVTDPADIGEAAGTDAGIYAMGLRAEQFENINSSYAVEIHVKDGSLSIVRKPATVAVADAEKTEGEADPVFTAAVEGLVNDSDKIDYTIRRNAGEHYGQYKIHASGAYSQGNYAVTYKYGILTIKEKEKDPKPTPVISNMPTDVPDNGGTEGLAFAAHTDSFDEKQTISFPGIRTTLGDVTGDTEEAEEGFFYLEDDVKYSKLAVNTEYTVTGVLMDKATSEALAGVEPATVTFTPVKPDGTVAVSFKVPKSILEGKTVVAFETLYENSTEIAVHHDLEDEDQTVVYPGSPTFHTTAATTSGKTFVASRSMTVRDAITYTNLKPGDAYEVTGTLHLNVNGTDGGTAKDADGNDITVTKTFVVDASGSGTWDMTFIFDGSNMSTGTKLVVFENAVKLKDGVKTADVLSHEDIADEGQTVSVTDRALDEKPEIRTTAASENGEKTVSAVESAVIKDTVTYTNLDTTMEYTIKGELHLVNEDGTDGGVLTTSEKKFTPDTKDGTVELVFTFDASKLAGRKTVVFEELDLNAAGRSVYVTDHSDLTDEGQTVAVKPAVPELHTTAVNAADGSKTVFAGTTFTLKDTVSYSSLTVGKTYQLTGTIHINSNGKDAGTLKGTDGKDITATRTFTPESSDGTVEMTFEIDGNLIRDEMKLVVFEDAVELTADGKIVADDSGNEVHYPHEDINDKDQTVEIKKQPTPTPSITPTPTPSTPPEGPGLHTTAYNASDGYDTVSPDHSVTVKDNVYYSGLIPGQQYTVYGVLHLKNADGTDGGELYQHGQPVFASRVFTPAAPNGTITLSFTFDASTLNERQVVAFETIHKDGHIVAAHADITDEAQTIYINKDKRWRRRRIRWISTGAGQSSMIFGGIGIAAVVLLAVTLKKRKKYTSD